MDQLTNEQIAAIYAMYPNAHVVHPRFPTSQLDYDNVMAAWFTASKWERTQQDFWDNRRLVLKDLRNITTFHVKQVVEMAIAELVIDVQPEDVCGSIAARNERVFGVDAAVFIKTEKKYNVYLCDKGVFVRVVERTLSQFEDAHPNVPNQLDIFDYLRSQQYALPYKGKSLFDWGVALQQSALTLANGKV